MDSSWIPVFVALETLRRNSGDRPKKPLSKGEQKAREIGYKIGRPIGVIVAIIFAIAMIVLICN